MNLWEALAVITVLGCIVGFGAWVYFFRYGEGYINGWLDCIAFMEDDLRRGEQDLWEDEHWDALVADELWSLDDAVLAEWMYDDAGEDVYDQEKDRGER